MVVTISSIRPRSQHPFSIGRWAEAGDQAGTAHAAQAAGCLQQEDFCAEPGRADRGRGAGRAAARHDQIVAALDRHLTNQAMRLPRLGMFRRFGGHHVPSAFPRVRRSPAKRLVGGGQHSCRADDRRGSKGGRFQEIASAERAHAFHSTVFDWTTRAYILDESLWASFGYAPRANVFHRNEGVRRIPVSCGMCGVERPSWTRSGSVREIPPPCLLDVAIRDTLIPVGRRNRHAADFVRRTISGHEPSLFDVVPP